MITEDTTAQMEVLYHQLVTGRLGFTAFFICLQVELEEVGIIG